MALREGKNLKDLIWSMPTLPKFSVKKGPLDFIEKMWKSQKRELEATFPISPLDDQIEIGSFLIDL